MLSTNKRSVSTYQSFESELFKAADKLRKNIDAAEYKHIVLGLIFLKYISDSFFKIHNKIVAGIGEYQYAAAEDPDEYISRDCFWVPSKARWNYLQKRARSNNIGKDLDMAMVAIERENPDLRGILPKVYSKRNIDNAALAGLIDLIEDAPISDEAFRSKDLLGRVYEYFLGQFALAEGQKGGQFYTPKTIVKLLVEILQPFKGRVYDPCCGSGGMFIMSENFVERHRGKMKDISIFGQESNQTTYRLCCMNLAIHAIDSSQVVWNNEGSFLKDAHADKKMDFILANPPFNDSDWSGEILQDDPRWVYGKPPRGNANFAWVQHFIHHLAPGGEAGFVLANGSLSSNTAGGKDIRKELIEKGLVDCIINLPTKLFLNTQIAACLWFISRKEKVKGQMKPQDNSILFIDADDLGSLINRRTREFSDEDIDKITNVYHAWKNDRKKYKNIAGFCNSAPLSRVRKNNYILNPKRYVTLLEEKDNFNFSNSYAILKEKLETQLKEEARLNKEIRISLNKIKYKD